MLTKQTIIGKNDREFWLVLVAIIARMFGALIL